MTEEAPLDIERQAAELATELAALTERKNAAEARARELLAAEDHKAG